MNEEHPCDWRLHIELQVYCCLLMCKTLRLWILQLNVSHLTVIPLNTGGNGQQKVDMGIWKSGVYVKKKRVLF